MTSRPSAAAKRCLDVAGAVLGLIVTCGPMLIIACAIRLSMRSPVLYRQIRPGLHAVPFQIVKFRTMVGKSQGVVHAHLDRSRLTRLGRFLRRTSLDELPELFNVLKGEMSLVGPRPLRPEYLPLYSPTQARRHEVMPGITGWAQINGRNNISWEEKLALDVWYVGNRSFLLDLKIIIKMILFKLLNILPIKIDILNG